MQLVWSQSIAAGATFDPLDNWNHQYPKSNCAINVMHKATAVGLVATFTALDTQILQEAPVPAGGTAGVTPTIFTAPQIPARAGAGDRLSLRYRNPTGGAITVDGVIDLVYGSGGKRRR